MFSYKLNNIKIRITHDPINKVVGDCLINYTTDNLLTGGLMFRQIHREGGSVIAKDCQGQLVKFGHVTSTGEKRLYIGEGVVTNAGLLLPKKLIHIVCPNYRNPEENKNKLNLFLTGINYSFALINELKISHSIRRVIYPSICTSLYGTPTKEEIVKFIKTIISNAQSYELKEITFVCTSVEEYELYVKLFTDTYLTFWDKLYNKIFK
jgi:O-acetyl-ADP-ribose deacetylase (regulator of RNase III)